MGTGFRKNRNTLKKRYLTAASQLIDQLQTENEALKTDPETVVGQLVPQFREIMGQNKKLSVLAAAILKANGGTLLVSKDEMESFQNMALSIKWELPEGITDVKDAKEFLFTYEAVPQEDIAQAQAAQTSPELDAVQTMLANIEAETPAEDAPVVEEPVAVGCPGIDLGDGNFSGCEGGSDCPVCEGSDSQ